MYTQEWYFVFPFGNIIFSFLVAQFLGTKRHIGFWYSFLWGVGFTFIVSWIITAAATPLNEPYKKNKRDIYAWGLCLFMAVFVVFNALNLWKAAQVLQVGKGDFSYFYAEAKQNAWRSVFFITGSITTLLYFFDSSIGDKKKEVVLPEIKEEEHKESEFVPETPNYEIAEREAAAKKEQKS